MEKLNEIDKTAFAIKQSGTYLISTEKNQFVSAIEKFKAELAFFESRKALSPEFLSQIRIMINSHKQLADYYNSEFVRQRKIAYKHLWNKGSIWLDDEQQTAIVTDDKYNLVVAAAGSGKTEVLITRIAYLIQRKPDRVEPNRILAIAFQRKAMEQIEDRLHQRYAIENVNVSTFHKLGKDILERSGRRIETTDIVNENKKCGFR